MYSYIFREPSVFAFIHLFTRYFSKNNSYSYNVFTCNIAVYIVSECDDDEVLFVCGICSLFCG